MASLAEMAAQSNQIAQQNNPNFAALNTIVQGRAIPLNGFSDFLQKTIEPARQRQHEASENLLNRQHTSSENLLNRQHLSAENEQNRRHNIALENSRNSLAKDLETFRHNYNKDLLKLQHSNTLAINDRSQNDMLERLAFQHRLDLNNKDYDAKRKDELYRRALEEQYYGLGGYKNVSDMSNEELQQRNYTLGQRQQQSNPTTSSAPNFSKASENSSDPSSSTIHSQPSTLDLPPLNVSGRITVDDLLQISQRYPYLSQTKEGRDFLNRLEQTINNNPEDRSALEPFLKELQSGKIPLVAPITKADQTPYKPLQPIDEQIASNITNSMPFGWAVPNWAMRSLINGTDFGVNALKNQVNDLGFYFPRQQEKNYDGLFGGVSRAYDNYTQANTYKDLIEEYEPIYDYIKQNDMKRIQISPNDQINNYAKKAIAQRVGLPDPFYVQAYTDHYGNITFIANGQMFEVDNKGNVSEVEL